MLGNLHFSPLTVESHEGKMLTKAPARKFDNNRILRKVQETTGLELFAFGSPWEWLHPLFRSF